MRSKPSVLLAVALILHLGIWPPVSRAQVEGDNPANLGQRTKSADCHADGGLPDPECTPGAVDPRVTQETIGSTICVSGYTATVRPPSTLTQRIKQQQYQAYGLGGVPLIASELDHLISLELGGAPADEANLWPELYEQAWGARVKDRVENRLHALVCDGTLPLRVAQHAIATDWIAAYHTYVLGEAAPPDLTNEPASEDEAANRGVPATVEAVPDAATATPLPAMPKPQTASDRVSPLAGGACPSDYSIKGNASSHIYHLPGGASYNVTKAEDCFATPSDAEAAGYRRALR